MLIEFLASKGSTAKEQEINIVNPFKRKIHFYKYITRTKTSKAIQLKRNFCNSLQVDGGGGRNRNSLNKRQKKNRNENYENTTIILCINCISSVFELAATVSLCSAAIVGSVLLLLLLTTATAIVAPQSALRFVHCLIATVVTTAVSDAPANSFLHAEHLL